MPHLSLAPTHTHTKPNMEATSTLLHGKSPFMIKIQFARRRRDMQNPKYHCRRMTVQAVLARPASGDRNMDILNSPLSTTRTSYNDNWFDHLAINYLSHVVQETVGLRNDERGYGSLVEAATAVSRSFNPTQQRELVIQALDKAFPKPILSLIRVMMPPSKFAREYFAVFTTKFFPWLVGSCEVRESEFNGRREKNVVHIKKCRFLEESNCVGMCTNLCKMPSQAFIKDSLGMPVNMVPNFDDMSCEMIFGQNPPAENDDPAFKQPCYKLCTAKRKHTTNCIS